MSLRFIEGKPGGGKSLLGMKRQAEELLQGNRPIVTCLAVDLVELSAYLERMGYKKHLDIVPSRSLGWEYEDQTVFHLSSRLRVITEQEMKRFFCFRSCDGLHDVPYVEKDEWKKGGRMDYSGIHDNGVLYILDEVHIAFGAREWAETGPQVLYYLSQHRKLGDDILCITQHIDNVDSQFKRVAQDFSKVTNMRKVKVGFFAMPSIFMTQTRLAESSDSPVTETGTFTLDVTGLARCYKTAGGIGIMGRGADTKEKRKGLHWAFGVAAVAALILGISIGPKYLALWYFAPAAKPSANVSAPAADAPVKPVQVNEKKQLTSFKPDSEDTNVLTVCGIALINRKLQAIFSDGTVKVVDSYIEGEGVWKKEKFYAWKEKPLRQMSSTYLPSSQF